MTEVLILGANGQLARNTTRHFLAHTDARLTLYLRRAKRLTNPDPSRVEIVEGDVLDDPLVRRLGVTYSRACRSIARHANGRPRAHSR